MRSVHTWSIGRRRRVTAWQVLIDTADDPTTHGLWPFEIVVAVGVSLPPILLGIFIGWAMRRMGERSWRHRLAAVDPVADARRDPAGDTTVIPD